MIEVSVALDADFLSFNLRPARLAGGRAPWMARKEFRQALSCGVDREAIVNTVYLGAAAPLFGPVTPGNRRWYSAGTPVCPAATGDRDRARQLLATAGLTDRNGDGMLEDAAGAAGAVLDPDPGQSPARARDVGHPGTAPPPRHRRRHRPARSERTPAAVDRRRLRRHLLRAPVELDRSRSRFLVELGALSFLEPGAGQAGDRLGAPHRRADARTGDGRRASTSGGARSPRSSGSSARSCRRSTSSRRG